MHGSVVDYPPGWRRYQPTREVEIEHDNEAGSAQTSTPRGSTVGIGGDMCSTTRGQARTGRAFPAERISAVAVQTACAHSGNGCRPGRRRTPHRVMGLRYAGPAMPRALTLHATTRCAGDPSGGRSRFSRCRRSRLPRR